MLSTAYQTICGVDEYAEYGSIAVGELAAFQGFAVPASAIHSAYSLAAESGDQLVRRTKLAWTQLRRSYRFEHSDSLGDIRAQAVLCCLDTLVTEPQGHLANITRCLQDIKRAGMTTGARGAARACVCIQPNGASRQSSLCFCQPGLRATDVA